MTNIPRIDELCFPCDKPSVAAGVSYDDINQLVPEYV